jgi:Tetratricopeptide repeat
MTKATPDSRRLSQLPVHEDPHHLGELFRSAKAAPEEDLPRLRWRLRTTLRQQAMRPRRLLRLALITSVVFLTGGVVGAVVVPYWEHRISALPVPSAETPARLTPKSGRKRPLAMAAEATPVEAVPVPVEESPIEEAAPVASHRTPIRLAAQRLIAPPPPPPPVEVPSPVTSVLEPTAPSPIAVEQALLGDVLKALRKQRDPRSALALLDDYARRFPGTVLAPEAAMLRAEALLGLGRPSEALSQLDGLALGSMPNQDERFVLRGELRAAVGRWQSARDDFETLLSTGVFPGVDAKTRDVSERALWGRASARSHLGDDAGARADLALYLRTFPSGRFATQAAALLQGSR